MSGYKSKFVVIWDQIQDWRNWSNFKYAGKYMNLQNDGIYWSR